MKLIITGLAALMLMGCGTVRYRVTQPTDGKPTKTELQWDVIELRFNDAWRELIKK